MTTITINPRSKAGRTLLQLAEILAVNNNDIIVSSVKKEEKQKTNYNQEFVEMVLKASKSKNRTTINPKDLWGSLGLK